MYVGYYVGDLVYVEVFVVCVFFVCQQVVDVGLYWCFLVMLVGYVDGEFLGGCWNLYVFGGQYEFVFFVVQSEGVGVVVDGQYQLGVGFVDVVVGGDLFVVWLQECVIVWQFDVGWVVQY